MTRRSGFTLVELLVAISILAIVAVLGWRGLDGIIRSRASLTARMEQTRGLQLAFAQLQNDCANLANNTLLHNRAYIQADQNSLTLVRTVSADQQATNLEVVSYRVNDGVLTRRESTATRDLVQLDTLWQAALSNTDASTSVALQSGVQGITMRYWITDAWSNANGVSTATTAAATTSAALVAAATGVSTTTTTSTPTGLEVSLSLQDQGTPMVKSFLLGPL